MSYTLEQLEQMPINLLRGIDIKSKEEEELVQKVLNKRMVDMPVQIDLDIPSSMTDNMNGEKEAKLQAEIDAKRAEARAKFAPQPEVGTVEIVPELKIEPEIIPEPVVEVVSPEIVVPPEVLPETVEIKKPFCEFCDSRGVRHKKECTRPVEIV